MGQREKIPYFKCVFILLLASFVVSIYHYQSPSGLMYLNRNADTSEAKKESDHKPFSIIQSYDPNFSGSKDETFENEFVKQNLVTSGRIFKGDKIRKFPENATLFRGKSSSVYSDDAIKFIEENQKTKHDCQKWGVVTTIFHPLAESVRRFMYRKNWCVVVVGDKGRPSAEVRAISLILKGEQIIL